ncbi:putative integral membrane protein [Coniochaeta sp. 2T2.1]|nr:putative integral membrane protein [Coniochaeta sp. 2T2.1]
MWRVGGTEIVERNHALVVNLFIWASLAFVVVVLRLYTRAVVIRQVWADDYLMVGAYMASVAFFVAEMYQIRYGLGRPVNPKTLTPFLQSLLATVSMYNVAQTRYKLSIAVQSYRLFSTDRSRKVIKGLFLWIFACGIMTITGSAFYCFPAAKAWDDSIDGWCVNRAILYYCTSAFNILNDLFLMALPFPFLLTLHVARKHRVVLCSVFSCGALVTIISACRLKSLHEYSSGPGGTEPVTGVDIALWSYLEINLAIICGSVPALKAFVSRVILGHKASSHHASDDSSSSVKRARNQSQSLDPNMCEAEGGVGGKPLTITVENSIEMRSCIVDDQGSETGLVITDGVHGGIPKGRVTVVTGPRAKLGI